MKTLAYHVEMERMARTLALSKVMGKEAFFRDCSPVYMEDIPNDRLPGPNYVKVRNIQTGICGSDVSMFTLHQSLSMSLAVMPSQKRQYMGHETVGIVEEAGKAVRSVRAGDRVIMVKYLSNCSTQGIPKEEWCEACRRGDYVMCTNFGEPARKKHMIGAGFGDCYYAPEDCVMKIDDSISNDQAVLYEPTAVSLHTVLKKAPEPGDRVVVFGGGMIGQNIVQCLKLVQPDCTVYLLDRNSWKQEMALKLGADGIITGNPYEYLSRETGAKYYSDPKKKNQVLIGGVDIVYDSIGADWSFNMGLRILRARGTYVKAGIQMVPTKIDETPLWNQELTVMGVNSYGLDEYEGKTYQSFELVDRLVHEGRLDLSPFITQRYPLSSYKDGFREAIIHGSDTMKVVIDCTR